MRETKLSKLGEVARNAIRMDGNHGVYYQHRFLCHADGNDCADGCDAAPDWKRKELLDRVATIMQEDGEI